jgi:hypothetical protein
MITKTGELRIVIGHIDKGVNPIQDLERAKILVRQEFGGVLPERLCVVIGAPSNVDQWLVTIKARR